MKRFLVVLCSMALACSAADTSASEKLDMEASGLVKVGDKAPLFQGSATDSSTVSLEGLRGKVVLLDFFATWCGPCMAEMPALSKDLWSPKRNKDFVLVAVGRGHTVAELAAFKQAKHFDFPIVADATKEIYGKYATKYIPRCYLIGRDGTVRFTSVGFEAADYELLKAAVETELKKTN